MAPADNLEANKPLAVVRIGQPWDRKATLYPGFFWSCPEDPELQRYLNDFFRKDHPHISPIPGYYPATMAARSLNGEILSMGSPQYNAHRTMVY